MKTTPTSLRIHHFLPSSRVNGPGERAVLWVQGCTLGCPGCFNPVTHANSDGDSVSIDRLMKSITALPDSIEGLTISGGEPLQQISALTALLLRVRSETHLSTLLFTGFTWNEIHRLPGSADLLARLDVVLAGRYQVEKRVASGLIGSSNKTVHFLTPRYSPADLADVPEAEVIFNPDGEIILSGIHPLQLDLNPASP